MSKNNLKQKPINEQSIVVTGASSGIGLYTALLAARKGARVVMAAKNKKDVEGIVEQIRKDGGQALAVECDVTKYKDLEHLRYQAVSAFGNIDTWINNVGHSIYGYLVDGKLKEEKKLFEKDFWSIRNGCYIAIEEMRLKGGTVINLGSEVSMTSLPLQGIYSATKHAIKAYTDVLRSELRELGIPIALCLVRSSGTDIDRSAHTPDMAAEAIVKCAENPQREVFIGGASRLFAVMDDLFPRLKDYVVEKTMKKPELEESDEALPQPPPIVGHAERSIHH